MKNTITIIKAGVLFFLAILFLQSCEKDSSSEVEIIAGTKGPYEKGIFISNEGGYGNNNGSISFYCAKEDTTYHMHADNVYNNIFQSVNNRLLGDVVQSIKICNDSLAFIVVNNSNKVEVVNSNTFQEIKTIENVQGPRYLAANDNKAYLSCWGDNTVKVIDLTTFTVSKSIAVGAGPEKMAIVNDKLFVANAGGWGTDSTISVIDIATEEVVTSISVKYSPRDIVVDKDGFIWALCFGKVDYDPVTYALLEETPSMVYKIDPSNNSVLLEVKLFDTQHPTTLDIDKDGTTLYLGGGYGFAGVYSLVIEGTTATATQVVTDDAYGFAYDANSDKLFVMVAPDFAGAGILYRYDTEGNKVGTYSVGIGPNGASFKNTK